jgi:hypothetical protein
VSTISSTPALVHAPERCHTLLEVASQSGSSNLATTHCRPSPDWEAEVNIHRASSKPGPGLLHSRSRTTEKYLRIIESLTEIINHSHQYTIVTWAIREIGMGWEKEGWPRKEVKRRGQVNRGAPLKQSRPVGWKRSKCLRKTSKIGDKHHGD